MPTGGHGAIKSSLPHVSPVQAGKLSTERGGISHSGLPLKMLTHECCRPLVSVTNQEGFGGIVLA